MISFILHNLIWTQALNYIAVCGFIGILGIFYRPLLFIAMAGFLFCLFFFRNPERLCKEAIQDANVLVCPADGKVFAVDQLQDNKDFAYRIAIFLSPFDVHVNWIPIVGTVQEVTYHKGAFKMAFLPKSSELNERNDVLIKTESGKLVLVRQIAGTIARVIICWVKKNEQVQAGQKFGMIKFGSRVEIFLPHGSHILVQNDQRVAGGQTVLGKLQ